MSLLPRYTRPLDPLFFEKWCEKKISFSSLLLLFFLFKTNASSLSRLHSNNFKRTGCCSRVSSLRWFYTRARKTLTRVIFRYPELDQLLRLVFILNDGDNFQEQRYHPEIPFYSWFQKNNFATRKTAVTEFVRTLTRGEVSQSPARGVEIPRKKRRKKLTRPEGALLRDYENMFLEGIDHHHHHHRHMGRVIFYLLFSEDEWTLP